MNAKLDTITKVGKKLLDQKDKELVDRATDQALIEHCLIQKDIEILNRPTEAMDLLTYTVHQVLVAKIKEKI